MALSQMRLVMMAPDSTKMSVLAMYSSSSLYHPQHMAPCTLQARAACRVTMEQTLACAMP